MVLVPGNHDRGLKIPEAWQIVKAPEQIVEEGFKFVHHLNETDKENFTWSGHVHPVIQLKSATDRLRLPCFVVGNSYGLLPAFGRFTGGFEVIPQPSEKIFVIAGETVTPL